MRSLGRTTTFEHRTGAHPHMVHTGLSGWSAKSNLTVLVRIPHLELLSPSKPTKVKEFMQNSI